MKLRLISEGEHKDAFGTHKWKTYAQIPTNADRIRSMSDEELAAKIEELCQYTFMQISVYSKPMGKAEWLEWLKQEAKNEL